jgi:ABC-type transporter MlaC component
MRLRKSDWATIRAFGFPSERGAFRVAINQLLLLFVLALSQLTHAEEQAPIQIANKLINEFVQLSPREPDNVRNYAQSTVLPHINLEQMAIGLCGRSQWAAWSKQEQSELLNALHNTLVRYVLEAGSTYKKQQLSVVSEEATSSRERVVRITISDEYFPAVSVDLFVQSSKGQWRAHDFAVAGISYVKMKRAQYKTVLAFGGLAALLDHLNGKNQTYVAENKLGTL